MKLFSAPMGSAPTGRLWLRWLALAAFVVGLAFAFVHLGFWQLDRLGQARAANSAVVDHENAPAIDFDTAFSGTITDDQTWQRVSVRGTFDGDHQLLVRYRTNADGVAGYEVLTPFHTTGGRWVIIDRGWAATANGQFPSALPAPSTGEVNLLGYVRRDENGSTDAITPLDGSVRLVNSTAIGSWLGREVANGYLSAIQTTPAATDGLTPVTPPALSEGNHFSYALQWFSFAVLGGIGLVVLIRSDVRSGRAAAAKDTELQEGEA